MPKLSSVLNLGKVCPKQWDDRRRFSIIWRLNESGPIAGGRCHSLPGDDLRI